MNETRLLLGAKYGRGSFKNDAGENISFHYSRVSLTVPLARSDNTAGLAAELFDCSDRELFHAVKGYPFPVEVDVDWDISTDGKGRTQMLVKALRPISSKARKPEAA